MPLVPSVVRQLNPRLQAAGARRAEVAVVLRVSASAAEYAPPPSWWLRAAAVVADNTAPAQLALEERVRAVAGEPHR